MASEQLFNNARQCQFWAYSVEKLPGRKSVAKNWNNCFVEVRLTNSIRKMGHQWNSVPVECSDLAQHRVFQQNRLIADIEGKKPRLTA